MANMFSKPFTGENRMRSISSVGTILHERFTTDPDAVFVVDAQQDVAYTYSDFLARVLSLRTSLSQLGVKKRSNVGLVLSNSFELLCLYFSILLLEAKAIPIDSARGKEEIQECIRLQADFVVYEDSDQRFQNLDERKTGVLYVSRGELLQRALLNREDHTPDPASFQCINESAPFLVTFTSGTTGRPKGVVHSMGSLVASALAFNKQFLFNKEHVFFHHLPMTYMAGILNSIVLPLLAGSRIVIGKRFQIHQVFSFWEHPKAYGANVFWFTPAIMGLLLAYDRGSFARQYGSPGQMMALCGTAPLRRSVHQDFESYFSIPVYQSYGLSETLFVSTVGVNDADRFRGVGRPLDGVRLRVDNGGEILLSVPWMFLGYAGQGENAGERQRSFYPSGDLGEVDSDGLIQIIGRKKDIIIKGGMNVNPVTIEKFLESHFSLREAVMIGMEDPILGQKVVCFHTDARVARIAETRKEINRKICELLGRYCVIDEFIFLSEIPRNINGKIDKQKIHALYLGAQVHS